MSEWQWLKTLGSWVLEARGGMKRSEEGKEEELKDMH